jgi:stage II sporulation protein D
MSGRMATVAAMVCAAALAAAVPTAGADVRIDGRGYGHGIGLAQYGAYGYARDGHRDYRWILAHYYRGTRVATAPGATMRVLLQERPEILVSSARELRSPGRSPIALSADRTYRFERSAADVRVVDTTTGRTKATVRSPAVAAGSGYVRLRGTAQNGVMSGRYRGDLMIRTGDDGLQAVNRVDLESYLRGVVPAEMPSSWSIEALKAQAVAARSYGLRSRRPEANFDVYADVRSQVYRGITGESDRGTTAVQRTARLAVYDGSAVAQTLFFSSSGGRTANVDEEWGGPAVPHLQSVDDPYDTISPYHRWTVSLSNAEMQQRLGALVKGDFLGIAVTARNSSGRTATVDIAGAGGTTQATGVQIRTALGLRSTWFYFSTSVSALAASPGGGSWPAPAPR